jgi:hypothetical protein
MQEHIFSKLEKENILELDAGWARFKIVITDEMDSGVWGYTNLDTHTIFLHKSLQPGPAKEVLMHEITHVILETIGYTSENELAEFSATNEDMTTKISRGVLLFANLNTRLMEILLEKN